MDTQRGFAVVIPVKGLADAKSRTGLPPEARAELVLDFLRHTSAMAADCVDIDEVIVVTPDPTVVTLSRAIGVKVLHERVATGLNAAARRGIAAARDDLGIRHAGVLMSDLPWLCVDDLSQVITEYFARSVPLYVADQHRTGTTFLLQSTSGQPHTAYGIGSAQLHESLGFLPAMSSAPGLRFDVDTAEDLARLELLDGASR